MADAPLTIGLLHPGAMGASIGAQLVANGYRVVWVSEGRSAETVARAEGAGLDDIGSLAALVDAATMIVSVCPPAEAGAVAGSVAELGFGGIYVDANAVSPASARRIADSLGPATFVDGGIVGPPVTGAGTTRLYVSGPDVAAATVASLFDGSDLEVRLVEGGPGAASAVKMCFAAWTKGTAALLMDICALAEAEGVTGSLREEWATSMPHLATRADRTPAGVGPKAWRFEGEMGEIAASFAEHGLPDGFHLAAAEVYARLASLKGADDASLDAVIDLLLSTTREQ